jgi:hypothetical protein
MVIHPGTIVLSETNAPQVVQWLSRRGVNASIGPAIERSVICDDGDERLIFLPGDEIEVSARKVTR